MHKVQVLMLTAVMAMAGCRSGSVGLSGAAAPVSEPVVVSPETAPAAEPSKAPEEQSIAQTIERSCEEAAWKAYEALRKEATLAFNKVPALEVARAIEDRSGITVVWLPDDSGADLPRVTLHGNTRLGYVLDRICEQTGTTWRVEGGLVVVGTPEALREYEMRIYPASDLLVAATGQEGNGAAASTIKHEKAAILVLLIKQACAPETWDVLPSVGVLSASKRAGAHISLMDNDSTYLVVQKADVHHCIEKLLTELRSAMKTWAKAKDV